MKKILLAVSSVSLCLCLTACGTNQSEASITNLSNQLDDTSNAISNIQTVNPSDITLTKTMLETIATKDSENAIYDNVINTQQSLLNEEYYKTDILQKTNKIKKCLSKDIKLSKAQASAVKDLTNSLNKYTNSVVYSKSEMNSAVKSISSLKKNVEKNSDKINAKLNRLACNSNARSSYYENLLKTLDEIENSLCLSEPESTNSTQPQNSESSTTETTENKSKSIKNIDTYQSENQTSNSDSVVKNENNCPNCQNNLNNQTDFANNNESLNNVNTGYLNNPTSNNTVYNRYNRFNPNRNTDTYGPTYRNIDTYGGNDMYGYGNFGNGMNEGYGYGGNFANRGFYGANNGITQGFGGAYNSNNYNRITTPFMATPVNHTPSQEISEPSKNNDSNQNTITNDINAIAKETQPRIENYEKVKEDNSIEKIESSSKDKTGLKTQSSDNETQIASVQVENNDSTENQILENNAVNINKKELEENTQKKVDTQEQKSDTKTQSIDNKNTNLEKQDIKKQVSQKKVDEKQYSRPNNTIKQLRKTAKISNIKNSNELNREIVAH